MKHLDIEEEDGVVWFTKDSLIDVLDSLIPTSSPEFNDGWNTLAGYLRLEFSE
jgi:hypothetical protein